jgi:hypothetical protein
MGVPVLEGVAVTVMITSDRFGSIRRAAMRAVRKYDLVYAAIGRENCSTSSSTKGTRTFRIRDADRVEGNVDAARVVDHGRRTSTVAAMVESPHDLGAPGSRSTRPASTPMRSSTARCSELGVSCTSIVVTTVMEVAPESVWARRVGA